jgi:hypothetical protein
MKDHHLELFKYNKFLYTIENESILNHNTR